MLKLNEETKSQIDLDENIFFSFMYWYNWSARSYSKSFEMTGNIDKGRLLDLSDLSPPLKLRVIFANFHKFMN